MTQFIFFSGKGGVGKSSMVPTQSIRFTTDFASNLGDVFEQEFGHQVSPIGDVLDTMEK